MKFDPAYPKKLCKALSDLQKNIQLCDITINIGGRAFHAHKAVLAACSSYFLAMFTSGFKESTASEISIDGKAKIFEILLQFAYTGELKITPKLVYDVLDMACYMQFADVYPMCCSFIQARLKTKSTSNSYRIPMGDVFMISQLARNHDCLKQLVKKAEKYMEENVQELKEADVFLQGASFSFLKQFLSREYLSSAKEEKQVLEMVIGWLKYDWENRRTHTFQLLLKVRLGLVPTKDLKELIDGEILEVPKCKDLLGRVLRLQSSKKTVTSLSHSHPKLFATRSIITAPITSVPGLDDYNVSNCEFMYYHAGWHCWKPLTKFDPLQFQSSKFHSLIVVNQKLYAAGGIEQNAESDPESDGYTFYISFRSPQDTPVCANDFVCYSAKNNKWISLPSMNKARHSFPLVYLDGFIYAISGTNQEGDVMSDVERYDMAKKEWQVLASLPDGYRWVSAVAYRGKILLYGVSTDVSNGRSCLHVIVVYHPGTDMWQTAVSEVHETSKRPAVLFTHNDECYRIFRTPLVNILEMQSQEDETIVTVGEEVKQDLMPKNTMGAFRIDNEVFVRERGFVYKTDLEIAPDQTAKVNLSKWERFRCTEYEHSNVTCFTFDRKKLE